MRKLSFPNPLTKDIIKAVDNSEVIDDKTIMSPIFGNMSPKKLSGGVRTLLLIAFDKKKVFNASTCGDNCAEWILKIAEDRKVVINLHHLLIVFIDEGAEYIRTPEFAKAVKNSDNYYVIFSRESRHDLPYSVEEIYEIKASGKYHKFINYCQCSYNERG